MQNSPRQTLYLLRHARAEPWEKDADDRQRRLDPRGRQHMRKLQAWFDATLAPPAFILCSPAARTRETLELLASSWPGAGQATHFRPGIYEASPGLLQGMLSEAFGQEDSVLLVGHNPGLEMLARAVLSKQGAGEITKMSAGSLAVIDFEQGWETGAGRGRLRHWVRRADFSNSE